MGLGLPQSVGKDLHRQSQKHSSSPHPRFTLAIKAHHACLLGLPTGGQVTKTQKPRGGLRGMCNCAVPSPQLRDSGSSPTCEEPISQVCLSIKPGDLSENTQHAIWKAASIQ